MRNLGTKIWSVLKDPERLEIKWIYFRQNRLKAQIKSLPKMTAASLERILGNDLGIQSGDTVCVHSAVGFLNLDMKPAALLDLLIQTVGPKGTLVFPTYPGASHEFLAKGQIFDVATSSSILATGLLTDLAWRYPGAKRSLHPTKSMAAIGPMAERLTSEHHLSPFPFDRTSPYFKLSEVGAKVIGLGVWTYNLSFVHCVEDTMRAQFPLCPYETELFAARCKDRNGQIQVVPTYAHDLRRISYDTLQVQNYMKKNVAREISDDLTIDGRRFFRVNAAQLYPRMCDLATSRITIFARAQKHARPELERERWNQLEQQAHLTTGAAHARV